MRIEHSRIRDSASEATLFRSRLTISLVITIMLSLLLLWRYMSLQVVNFNYFSTASDRNRIHTLPAAPKRGLIYDRDGVVLAQNQATYSLVLTKERIDNLDDTLGDLQQLFDISNDAIEKFLGLVKQRKPYQSVPLLFKLSEDEISRFSVNRYRLPGVEIVAQLTRDYPQGEAFSHLLGYVGRINAKEQSRILADEASARTYAATSHIGKLGIEGYYEDFLHGGVGAQHVESNAHGRILRVLESEGSSPGSDIVMTIDASLQKQIHQLLDEKRASVVVMDVNSGAVLAMVSTPSFDNNAFVKGISQAEYRVLSQSIELPLFNRSLQGQYPPGSTIKPILGLAGLHHEVVSEFTTVADPGWYKLPNDDRLYRDWKRTGHADRVNLRDAIVQSCDVYYYDMAFNLGIDRIHPFMQHFGLGSKSGIDSTSEASGLVPSRDWKRNTKKSSWFPGETLNVGIGQGYMLATPLQLALSTSILATRGKPIVPHIVSNSRALAEASAAESAELPIVPSLASQKALAEVSDFHWQQIHDSMRDVVHSLKGTARSIGVDVPYQIAGKTGTAQVIGIAQGEEYDEEAIAERKRDHALFVGFAPYEKPEIAVAVIIENGGSGAATAAPVARQVFDWYMDGERRSRKNNRPSDPSSLYAALPASTWDPS